MWILQTRNGKRTAKASVRIAVEMCEEGIIDKERAVELVDANQLYQVLLPDFDPKAKKKLIKLHKVLRHLLGLPLENCFDTEEAAERGKMVKNYLGKN